MSLTVWETPFASSRYPSVGLIVDSHGDRTATVVVAPQGIDQYPKYLVRFEAVLSCTVEEEAHGTAFLAAVSPDEPPSQLCTALWADSPALAYEPYLDILGLSGPIRHYLVFGSDNNVGVVAAKPPIVSVIEGPVKLQVEYEV
jgi:hypothetical protein